MGQPVLPGSLGKIYFVFKSMKSKKKFNNAETKSIRNV